ncbi:MAG: CinA family protein [Pseudomonadota bacterium]
MLQHKIWRLAEAVVTKAGAEGKCIATAESCTGGLIGGALTSVPGSSAVFDRGFITYSNEAKAEMLGVPSGLINAVGAVSGEVALAMAQGALKNSSADVAVSVTGIAGPGGGDATKPVGLVWFGLAAESGESRFERRVFAEGSRDFVRDSAVATSLRLILQVL